MIQVIFPNVDYTSPGGVLQLAFVQFATVALGFAVATLLGGWASDESSGRLDVVLSSPVSRARWLIRSGLGVYAAIVVLCALIGIGILIGAASVGSDAVTPVVGLGVFVLYLAALAGIGIAVAGLVRPSLAAPVVAAVTLASFAIELFAIPLKLPDAIHQLAPTSHLGQPMVGMFDVPGLVAWVVIAVGGLIVGAWGLSRRDLRD
jgi:ABC-2 type transport system permease protein